MAIASAFLAQTIPTLAVAALYCLWYRAHLEFQRRDRTLRERVTYMLWCAAHEAC
jgi:hypothetical protein